MAEKSLYHTYVHNQNGLVGVSYVIGQEGLSLGVSSSLVKAPGTNPEQFIGFALSTCFNATLRIVQQRLKMPVNAQAQTRVDQFKDAKGYKFVIEAQILLAEYSDQDAQKVLSTALNECPVAKLLEDNENVSFRLVHEFDEEPLLGE
ncbi:OsmC family peroxiredoxin [Lactiplantibacillus plantarum]|uniref:OsmC family protein n=1 Tax=Lactiplantibacillus plantarum TaxID=1590 RepID=UPI0021A80B34|nr:OsmC family protein [Lactiplantibacillus plantarum]MCT3214140.1 OsmC family peroxiredoxin [Lactiplantibacillus plantarum]MCT3271720.1 OsmC family peroxiredoxin [Lactiplantibacillus plantarum]